MTRYLSPLLLLLFFSGANAACDNIYRPINLDGDELIGEIEFRDLYRECGIYDAWDANVDGVIDEREFSAGLFGIYDLNDDDYLNEDEWREGLREDDPEGFWEI